MAKTSVHTTHVVPSLGGGSVSIEAHAEIVLLITHDLSGPLPSDYDRNY